MNDEGKARYEARLLEFLKGEVSRAQMLKAAGIGLAAAAAPGVATAQTGTGSGPATGTTFPYFPNVSGPYTTETMQNIFNTLLTFEHLVVSIFYSAVNNAGKAGLNSIVKTILQAVLAQEQYHADFLASLGAVSMADAYTVPDPTIFTNPISFLKTMELGETLGTSTYMAAAREFAELGQPTLVKYAFQIGATEAEHRVLARGILVAQGDASSLPPNNKAFETDQFIYVRDAYSLFQQFGFIGGSGTPLSYPGRDAALAAAGTMASALIQQTPNNATASVTPASNLTGATATEFTTQMSGSVEVPPGDPNGKGVAGVAINAGLGQICFMFRVMGIKLPAIAAHIHRGPAGVAGPVVVPLTPPDALGLSGGCVTADPTLIADILAHPANYYVNVHTTDFPAGAVRGQLA